MDDGDRKLWKEHQDIIQYYLKSKKSARQKVTKGKNIEMVGKILEKDKNNLFLKKIIEKGTTFDYDQDKLEQEVLVKLKNLGHPSRKKLSRCQTAKVINTNMRTKV